jgi:hypothetical protein
VPEPLTPTGATPAAHLGAQPLTQDSRPLTQDAQPRRQRSEAWALLFAALVILVGAGVGAGGFFVEQATANWHPHVTRTQTGWRITEVRMLGFGGLTLCNGRIAWQDGSSILLLDLRSGKAKLLGPGSEARTTWPPAISARYVVWFEGSRAGASSAGAWTYDTSTRRRRQVASVGDVLSLPSVSGTRTVWCTALNGQPRIVGVDLTNDKSLFVASEYGQPVNDGELVVWARSTGGAPSAFVLVDLTQGRSWTVAPGGAGGAGGLTGFDLSGRTLVWGRQDAQTGAGSIVAQNVDTGATSVVAESARMATAPSIDGDAVVWAQQTPDGAAYQVMGRRLSGGPAFQIARVDGRVQTALVSDGTVAWLVQNFTAGGPAWIETARLPR